MSGAVPGTYLQGFASPRSVSAGKTRRRTKGNTKVSFFFARFLSRVPVQKQKKTVHFLEQTPSEPRRRTSQDCYNSTSTACCPLYPTPLSLSPCLPVSPSLPLYSTNCNLQSCNKGIKVLNSSSADVLLRLLIIISRRSCEYLSRVQITQYVKTTFIRAAHFQNEEEKKKKRKKESLKMMTQLFCGHEHLHVVHAAHRRACLCFHEFVRTCFFKITNFNCENPTSAVCILQQGQRECI